MNTQSHSGDCAETERLWSTQQDVFIEPFFSRLRNLGEREATCNSPRWLMTPRRLCSRHNKANGHKTSKRLWLPAQDLHKFKADKIPRLGRGNIHKVLLLTKKLFAKEICWERENLFSVMSNIGYISHSPQEASYSAVVDSVSDSLQHAKGGHRMIKSLMSFSVA